MVAFTAHFYGIDPETVDQWQPKRIVKWHTAAVNLHNKLNKVPDK